MEFVDYIIGMEQRIIESLVYAAQAQGLRAGVRPYTGPQPMPESEEETYLSIKRAVFIEYPTKTLEWTYGEVQAKFLDSLPQYDR